MEGESDNVVDGHYVILRKDNCLKLVTAKPGGYVIHIVLNSG